MSPIHHLCRCGDTRNVERRHAERANVECQFRLFSPHPTIQMVVISNPKNHKLFTDRSAPHNLPKMIYLANQAVKQFELNPAQALWIEHNPSQCGNPSCAGFNLIQFDWLDGQATSSYRSPIHEDWYLSWLENEIYF
jgi:hypothetical protein